MDNYEKLRPEQRQIRSFQQKGMHGKLETWYEFELNSDNGRLLERAIRVASKAREKYGDENYFYMAGYIKACINNSFRNNNSSVHSAELELADHHFSFLQSVLFEYKSYCDELEKSEISLLDDMLDNIEHCYKA